MQLLGADEIESLSLEMAKLEPVGAETTESIFIELAALAERGRGRVGRHRRSPAR